MTSGVLKGLSGTQVRGLTEAWVFAAAIAASICAFNVLTRVHDRPDQGVATPVVLETTSLAVNIAAFVVCAAMAVWIRRRRPGAVRVVAVGAAGLLVYATMHIGGFMLLRRLLFPPLLHCAYDPGPLALELPYEFAKDTLAYLVATSAFWLRLGWTLPGQPEAGLSAPSTFDIRDGTRLVRAPISDILAVRSAGNYVEFLLADGRELLMRSPLSAVETALAPAGFLRTHRSWLLNAARVTALRPEGSGDYAVELGTREAPLSRRFPQALAALRG